MKLNFFLLALVFCSLLTPIFSEPLVDFRPGYRLVYRGEITVFFASYCPPKYQAEPAYLVNITIEAGGSKYTYYGYCFLVNGSLGKDFVWKQVPFFTKKYLNIGEKIDYNGRTWTVESIVEVNYSNMILEGVLLRHGKYWRIYDRVSGLLIKGYVFIGNRSFLIELSECNLEWIYVKYSDVYIDWYTLSKILKTINGTRGLVKVYSIGKSVLGRDIWAVEVGYSNATKIILVSAGIHGTEVIGVRVALYSLKKLLSDNKVLKSMAENGIKVVFVMPLNPDGLESGKVSPPEVSQIPYVRKNARLVDLNRNFGIAWSKKGSSNIYSSKYRGPKPFSEPEAIALKKFVENKTIIFHIDLHSGDKCIIVPWPVGKEKDRITRKLAWLFGGKFSYDVVQGSAGGLAYYYTYATKPETVSIIVELYRVSSDYWFTRYNPPCKGELEGICWRFYKALSALIQNPELKTSSSEYLFLYLTLTPALVVALYIILKVLRRQRKLTVETP